MSERERDRSTLIAKGYVDDVARFLFIVSFLLLILFTGITGFQKRKIERLNSDVHNLQRRVGQLEENVKR